MDYFYIHQCHLIVGEIDNIRQNVQSLHEDLKGKQKDLDFIASQQSQVLDSINSLREAIYDGDGGDLTDSSLDGLGKLRPSIRRRTAPMHPLSECAEES